MARTTTQSGFSERWSEPAHAEDVLFADCVTALHASGAKPWNRRVVRALAAEAVELVYGAPSLAVFARDWLRTPARTAAVDGMSFDQLCALARATLRFLAREGHVSGAVERQLSHDLRVSQLSIATAPLRMLAA